MEIKLSDHFTSVSYTHLDVYKRQPYGLPEILSVGLIAVLHWRKGNSLLSIGIGTVFYMFLVQAVFR